MYHTINQKCYLVNLQDIAPVEVCITYSKIMSIEKENYSIINQQQILKITRNCNFTQKLHTFL